MNPANTITGLAGLGLLAAVGVGVRLYRRTSPADPGRRLAAACAPALLVMAILAVAARIAAAPLDDTEYGLRLASVAPVFYGYQTYYPPDQGPILAQTYAPMSYLVYLPAVWLRPPAAAVIASALLAALLFFGPAVAVHFWPGANGRRLGWPGWLAPSAFVLLMVSAFGTSMSAFRPRPDAPALGLGLLAWAVLCLAPPDRPGWRRLLLSATLAALSVWSKQVMAPLLVALVLSAAGLYGWRAAGRFILALTITGVLVSAAFFLAYWPPQVLLANILVAPGRHPWQPHGPRQMAEWVAELTRAVALPLALALGLALSRWFAGDGPRPDGRRFLRRHPWVLLGLAALCLLPTCLLQRMKVGGVQNAYTLVVYPLALAATLALQSAWQEQAPSGAPGSTPAPAAGFARYGALALAVACLPIVLPAMLFALRDAADVGACRDQVVYAYCRRHPGEVYFPWHPLPVLLAEGKLYHTAEGIQTLEFAGLPVTPEHLRAHLPANLRYIAIPESFGRDPEALRYLPGFTRRAQLPELPGWRVYAKDSP